MWRRESKAHLLRAADDAENLELTADAKTDCEQPQPPNSYGSLVVMLKMRSFCWGVIAYVYHNQLYNKTEDSGIPELKVILSSIELPCHVADTNIRIALRQDF